MHPGIRTYRNSIYLIYIYQHFQKRKKKSYVHSSNEQWLLITLITVINVRRSLDLRLNPRIERIIDYKRTVSIEHYVSVVKIRCVAVGYCNELHVIAKLASKSMGAADGILITHKIIIAFFQLF